MVISKDILEFFYVKHSYPHVYVNNTKRSSFTSLLRNLLVRSLAFISYINSFLVSGLLYILYNAA